MTPSAGAWVDELPSVLWGLRTTPNRSTGRTPFFLVYGAEAVLPSDLLHNAPRFKLYSEDEANQARQDAVDLLEEERETAMYDRPSISRTCVDSMLET